MKIKNPVLLLSSILLCELAGIIGSASTITNITSWYSTLSKPFFNPPSWLFGPVWTILYLLMGIALYLVWLEAKKNKRAVYALKIFFIHLVVNSLWSIVFFGLHALLGSVIVILILLVLIIYLISLFGKINKTAALLLVPYLVWVSFATILNFSVWILNR